MVQFSPTLDRTFFALSDPTRRAILARLARGTATITELAGPIGMTLTGLKKHVAILEEAKLVTTEKVGRERVSRLRPEGIDDASAWLEAYRQGWEDRFDRLEALIERRMKERS